MNKIMAILAALVFSVSLADPIATQTDLDYVLGPIEMIDGTETEEVSIEPYVYVEIIHSKATIHYGDEITMACVVVGLDNIDYLIQWQYCEDIDTGEYNDIDCHDATYTFTATPENIGYYYRVVIYQIKDEGSAGNGSLYQSTCADAETQEKTEAEIRAWAVYEIQDEPAAA